MAVNRWTAEPSILGLNLNAAHTYTHTQRHWNRRSSNYAYNLLWRCCCCWGPCSHSFWISDKRNQHVDKTIQMTQKTNINKHTHEYIYKRGGVGGTLETWGTCIFIIYVENLAQICCLRPRKTRKRQFKLYTPTAHTEAHTHAHRHTHTRTPTQACECCSTNIDASH